MKLALWTFLSRETLMFHGANNGNVAECLDELGENRHTPRTNIANITGHLKGLVGRIVLKIFEHNGVGMIGYGLLCTAHQNSKEGDERHIGTAKLMEKLGKRVLPGENELIPRIFQSIGTITEIRVELNKGRSVHHLSMERHAGQTGKEEPPGKEKGQRERGGKSEEWKSETCNNMRHRSSASYRNPVKCRGLFPLPPMEELLLKLRELQTAITAGKDSL
ncbi:hypothetical protein HYW84_03995 [Candidatus Peregrinibacteria bacterium]|nr:hypothetical protein [Candidatus Peregrinibacteria bacterium]